MKGFTLLDLLVIIMLFLMGGCLGFAMVASIHFIMKMW